MKISLNTLDHRQQIDRPFNKAQAWMQNTLIRAHCLLQRIKRWHQRYRQRQALARLSAYEMKDMGFTRADVLEEVNKPCWRE
ncbi:MAG: DUF1127 domain-containing protein [Hahellaceae bacterium]|nr:DUF1127 domain-containing protein [Hahellaceae bacterium]MCP5168926.1 DUF1127 domain-containing protein [Hahellaceae bacterium]